MDNRNATLMIAIAHFDAEEYRDALLAFEEIWKVERSDLLRALVQLSNALLQLRLGLLTAPQRTLKSAALLLETLPDESEGLPITALRRYIYQIRACLPPNEDIPDWQAIPRFRFHQTEGLVTSYDAT